MSGRRRVGALVCAPLGAAFLTGCDIIPASGWALDLVTVSADGADGGNAPTQLADVSGDGTKVLFTTKASNFGPNDTNDNFDVYMRDLDSGTTTLVSSNAAGTDAGNSGSGEPTFSPDGTKVVYASTASDLGPIDSDLASDIYLRDLITGTVTRIDPGPDACGDAHSGGPTFSPDGNKVTFTRDWFLLESNNATDLFVHDLRTGTTVQVSRHESGAMCTPDSVSGFAAFSPDSSRVAFLSTANDLGSPDAVHPSLPTAWDGYLYDLGSGIISLISVDSNGTNASNNVASSGLLFTPDGTRVLYTTQADNLGPTDTNLTDDIYARNLVVGTTDLVSANADGTDAAGAISPVMSPDGTKVAFSSAGNTHGPVDTDTGILGLDVYVRDLTTEITTLVSVNAAGTDSGNSISGAPEFAGNDKIVFASQATDLAPPDDDTETDLFLRDLVSGTTTLLSSNATGSRSGNGEVFPSASTSADGSVITFATTGSNHGARDTNGFEDIYVVRYHDRGDLSVTAGASPEPVALGGELIYDVGVTNAGPETSEDGTVIVALPEGTTLLDADATGGACAQPIPERPDIVACELGDLAPASSAGAVISAEVSAPPGSVLTAVVAAGAKTFDPVSNNVVEVNSTVASSGA